MKRLFDIVLRFMGQSCWSVLIAESAAEASVLLDPRIREDDTFRRDGQYILDRNQPDLL